MRLTSLLSGRFIPWKSIPGEVWGGKQRKIPRLTQARKSAFLNELLLCQQNEFYLSRPYIDEKTEESTIKHARKLEISKDDEAYYNVYKMKFNRRFPTRTFEELWYNKIKRTRHFPDL